MRDRNTEGVVPSRKKRLAEAEKKANAWGGLQVVEKKVHGVTVGFIVGWWTCVSRWGRNRNTTFRNFREGVVWPCRASAIEFRDSVEARRKDRAPIVTFTSVE